MTRSVLVEPREPYRVKAGIFELDSTFDASPVVSLDICVRSRERGPLGIYAEDIYYLLHLTSIFGTQQKSVYICPRPMIGWFAVAT
jgi:hypothetical protein